jgi:hypothetical protein
MPRDGAGNASLTPTGFSSQSAPLSQSGQPLGLFTGEPMPKNPLAPSIWDFLDNSRSPRDDGEDWIRLFVRR